jgi:hypothetical protein
MNFAKNIKWQLVLAALGLSLVLIPRANSQEIVNTDFSTPSTSAGGNFNAAAPADINTTAAVTSQSEYTPVSALSVTNNGMQRLNAPRVTRQAGMLIALVILAICYAIMKKVAANRREAANTI